MNCSDKDAVKKYWEDAPCGNVYAKGGDLVTRLASQASARYDLEPYIETFARFADAAGEDVLEVGVGMGADHVRFAIEKPRRLAGVDITNQAVALTRQRLEAYDVSSDLRVADAESLPFRDNSFSFVYSWGVLHHTPDTERAVNEIKRVLKPGGRARIMIYNRNSVVGFLLWLRHGLLTGRPYRSMAELYAHYLESPGTKAYSVDETKALFSVFDKAHVRPQLSFADLMQGAAGQRHGPWFSRAIRLIWPRRVIRRFFAEYGLYLLIDAEA